MHLLEYRPNKKQRDRGERFRLGTVQKLCYRKRQISPGLFPNIVERVAVNVDDWPEVPTPILFITIGGKEAGV